MRLSDAAKTGIRRVRLPIWADQSSYLKIDIIGDGLLGPWVHLYDKWMQNSLGMPTPQDLLNFNDIHSQYEPYEGLLEESDYCEEVSSIISRVPKSFHELIERFRREFGCDHPTAAPLHFQKLELEFLNKIVEEFKVAIQNMEK